MNTGNYKSKNLFLFFLVFFLIGSVEGQKTKQQKISVVASVPGKIWSAEKAWAWYNINGLQVLTSCQVQPLTN
jgi:hypothetical protein